MALIGWDVADQLFGDVDPLDKAIRIAGVPFRVVGVSEKKGVGLRQLAGHVRGHSARRLS